MQNNACNLKGLQDQITVLHDLTPIQYVTTLNFIKICKNWIQKNYWFSKFLKSVNLIFLYIRRMKICFFSELLIVIYSIKNIIF